MAGMKVTYSEEIENTKTAAPIGVADFLLGINATLSRQYARIEGEVTSVKDSYATAIYFTIKDTAREALLNCVIWRTTYNQNGVQLKEGDTIIVSGVPEIYAARGTFSVKVQTIEYAGEGALKKSYDALRAKLTAEGLLSSERKRLLPAYPKRIGVITSRSGVVIQDFNSNLGRYGFKTVMVDSRVEGKDAIHEILAALKTMSKVEIDVLVIMRGGGSWESLQAFNTESVVRAIAGFKSPVLTGIGHDVDVTLAELVADRGASTPTAVAEVLNETWDTLVSSLDAAESKIRYAYERRLAVVQRVLDTESSKLLRTYDRVLTGSELQLNRVSVTVQGYFRNLEKTIREASMTFERVMGAMRAQVKESKGRITTAQHILIKEFRSTLGTFAKEIRVSAQQVLVAEGRTIKSMAQSLASLEQGITLSDPSRNLKLGYSLSYVNGKLVRGVGQLQLGDTIETRLDDGSYTANITKII